MSTDPPRQTAHRRLTALVALAALALAVVVLVVAGIRRWDVLLGSLASLAVAVAAAWVVLTRRGPRRLFAAVVLAAALVVFLVVLVASGTVFFLLVALALAAVAVGAADRAIGPTEGDTAAVTAEPARTPVLIMNLRSGGGKAERFALVDRCRERGIEPIVLRPGDDLLQLAEDAIARGADVIGMAGGDGSQALVASVASRHGVPLVVIPAGTRNHFALDLGLDREDVVGALDAYADGIDIVIDLAEVNGRPFVNNASMGVYARVVQSSEYRDAKMRTAAAMLPDILGPDAVPLDLRFPLPSGEQATTAQLLLVSNNAYQLAQVRGGGTRDRLDAGVLGVASVRLRGAADVERFAALEVAGQVRRFPGWHEWTTPELTVQSNGPIEVGVDGEALALDPPLEFKVRPGALTVRLPRHTVAGKRVGQPVQLGSKETFGALWRTAVGRRQDAQ